ncbi:14187_t:CDS:2, partial [Acaulospora morrowiae]
GGMKRKEQRFNSKSAGVTSTMLIMAIIGAFTPTLFYQTYASYNMKCRPVSCLDDSETSCISCVHSPVDPVTNKLYEEYVTPLMYFSAVVLLLSYFIGLWFTLRTHAALVWQTHHAEHEPTRNISNFIPKRLVPPNILQQLLPHSPTSPTAQHPPTSINSQRSIAVPETNPNDNQTSLSHEQNLHIAAETLGSHGHDDEDEEEEEEITGHDSPNWGKVKSGIVLLSFTALYSLIAEILVENIDEFVSRSGMTEKFTGLTLIALVPTVTEFVNAISFALNNNIALSLEIGSAYALQVCLLQIPAMVAFSGWYNRGKKGHELKGHTFTWDMFAVIFSVCMLTYTYIEGKSNYFKGSILVLCYMVLMAGFYWAPDRD